MNQLLRVAGDVSNSSSESVSSNASSNAVSVSSVPYAVPSAEVSTDTSLYFLTCTLTFVKQHTSLRESGETGTM
ncbi:MAG: hypothetical protein J07HB67_02082 [halophilic archaeon J07HB67]|nr:MAG: hypothetical protein J07HB67_02082 [halophilic archaeon J07HB67]